MEMVRVKYEDVQGENNLLKDSDSAVETTENESTNNKNETDLPHNSLLALLDDKNRSISSLKRQIHNQKLQLGFYLHRVLNSRKVIQLAESCVPHEAEENLQLNLAMNKFCKQSGLKSRIMNLHARMVDMEKRIIRMTLQQEDMIREIVTNLIEFVKKSNDGENNNVLSFLAQLNNESGQLETLAKILTATNKLRKELDTFRTCCNRLIIIEDERNSLVEQVYSMPVAQRLSYGVLLATQYEKMRLEREVQEIKQEQIVLQERLKQLSNANIATGNIQPLSEENDLKLHKMLEAVNCEAVNLLELTKDQKEKYIQEISKLKESNTNLSQQVASLQEIAREKEDLEYKMSLAIKEFQKLKEMDHNKSHEYSIRVKTLIEENSMFQEKLKHYHNIEEQVKWLRTQVEDVDTIRSQRDYYKAQVDDLQAIRAAYAQLVEHCPARGDEMDARQQMEKISDLEKLRDDMALKIGNLNDVVADQESQIKHLLIIIDKLGKYKETQEDIGKGRKFKNAKQISNTHSMFNKDSGYSTSDSRSAYSQTDTDIKKSTKSGPSVPIGVYKDKSTTCNWSNNQDHLDSVYENIKKRSSQHQRYVENAYNDFIARQEEEFGRANSISFPRQLQSSMTSTTSVEIQSVNQDGKSESLKAVLESSSSIEGTIQVNSASALSLKLTCGGTTTGNNNGKNSSKGEISSNGTIMPIINEENERNDALRYTNNIDEYELMKDASKETVVVTLPSVHRQLGNLLSVKCLEYTEEILNKDDDEVDVIISRESIPSRNISDEDVCRENNIVEDEEENTSESYEDTIRKQSDNESSKVKETVKIKMTNLTGRLRQLTTDLDDTLSRPGGKDTLLNTVKLMYNNIFNVNDRN